ncbi:2-isopropylmalate synthase [Egbenema bharatensis]|uniref:2-isopropylmalate synthase n=1 Tax=Egbenema bharatensis TaxID=3463334 RepID=UPI003A84356F
MNNNAARITLFDTTLRDGELALKSKFSIPQKLQLAEHLVALRVEVLEIGYPGMYSVDEEAMQRVSKQVKPTTLCGLANSRSDEITKVATALKQTDNGRINVYTPTRLTNSSRVHQNQTLETIQNSIALARNHCDDVQWTAFDATRSQSDFLCRSIETAIRSGATTVTIADSLGIASPQTFADLLESVMYRVPNIEQATIGVHCHDDLGFAVENSLIALDYGVRQIECSINGLGARKGNADLGKVVRGIQNGAKYQTAIDPSRLEQISALVKQITNT